MSIAVLSRKSQIKYNYNPKNTPSSLYGLAGRCQHYKGESTNLAKRTKSDCSFNSLTNTNSNNQQYNNNYSVKSSSTYRKNRINWGPYNNQCTTSCPKNNIVKSLQQSYHDVDLYIKKICEQSAEKVINPNDAYINYNPAEHCCNNSKTSLQVPQPIVKITNIPDMGTYLSAKYLKNNCIPEQPNIFQYVIDIQNYITDIVAQYIKPNFISTELSGNTYIKDTLNTPELIAQHIQLIWVGLQETFYTDLSGVIPHHSEDIDTHDTHAKSIFTHFNQSPLTNNFQLSFQQVDGSNNSPYVQTQDIPLTPDILNKIKCVNNNVPDELKSQNPQGFHTLGLLNNTIQLNTTYTGDSINNYIFPSLIGIHNAQTILNNFRFGITKYYNIRAYEQSGLDNIIIIPEEEDKTITGTAGVDIIYDYGGGNTINALAGDDAIYNLSTTDGDLIYAGPGDDFIYTINGVVDTIYGGGGTDTIYADGIDIIHADYDDIIYIAGKSSENVHGANPSNIHFI